METTADSERIDREAPSGTVTFLFTDIEGSTKLLERLRDQYALLLDEQQQIMRATFAHWGGHEIDTQGDSFFAVFPRAIDAVCCVMEAQHKLAEYKWPAGAVVRVRMGLHTGEPLQVRTGYVGMDVHRAARIAAAGHGGQVLLSQTTRELVYQDLPKGVALRDLGQHKLKDIRFPQQIYQLEIEGLPVEFPQLKTLSVEEEPPTPGEPPYKGLQYFDEADAVWFFGREQVSQQLAQAVQEQRFLAVIGASGSGKSSVVRAGLAPTLTRSQPGRWKIFIITPTSHPLESMAVSLTRSEPSVSNTATLLDDLRQDPRSLHLYILKSRNSPLPFRGGVGGEVPECQILLVVDQFEELFTQCRDEVERQAFVDNLLYAAAAEDGPTRVLIALRADFYQHLAQYAGLRAEVAKHQEYLGAMEADELRQAIEEPAHRGGWEFSPGLVELMLHDIGAAEGQQPEPGALPLLSHALLETWKRRRANLMSLKAYSEAGGVRGAIAKTAESVYYGELTPEQQVIARNIFLRLTELGEGTQDTRRRVAISELTPPAPYGDPKQVEEVLVKLADARLITTSEGSAEVAHEALIREWPTLRDWLSEDREGLHIHRRLTEAAQEWELLERDPGALYRGARLVQSMEWAQANPSQLNAQEQAFLDASRDESEREARERVEQNRRELEAAQKLAAAEKQRAEEQARSATRLRRRALYLSVAMFLAGLLAVAAIVLARVAGNNAQTAQANARSAQTAEANAIQQQQVAEEQANLSSSRELAAAAINNLETDPELSILLALESIKKAETTEGLASLRQALMAYRLSASIQAHTGEVLGVAASPDGKHFATLGRDELVKIWTLGNPVSSTDPTPLFSLTNPFHWSMEMRYGPIIAYSPDSSRLAVIGEKGGVNIWDANSGQRLQTLTLQQGNVSGIAFSPDGKRLATTDDSGSAVIWDVLTGQDLLTITVPEYQIFSATFTPDGKQLVTTVEDASVRFWDLDLDPGKELVSRDIGASVGIPRLIAFSPSGKFLAIGGDTGAQVWETQELRSDPAARPLYSFSENIVYGLTDLAYTRDGAQLLLTSLVYPIKIRDATTGVELFALPEEWPARKLANTTDAIHLLSAHQEGSVKIWDISPTGSFGWWTIFPVDTARFSTDGKTLRTFYIPGLSGKLFSSLWEPSSFGIQEPISLSLNTGEMITAAQSNSDLSLLATAGNDMVLKIWDVNTGQLSQSFPINISAVPGGHNDYINDLQFSPDSTQIVTAGKDRKAIVWDRASGKPLLILSGHNGPVNSADFSPDGALIATGSGDATARIWDATTGQALQTLEGHKYLVLSVVFSPDGKRLLSGGGDNNARLWDVQTGEALLTLSGHTGMVDKVAFSPDGRLVAAGSGEDGTVIIYDASSGQPRLTLPGHDIVFAPDGISLVIISDNFTGRGYYLDPQHTVDLARSRLTRSLTPEECQLYLHLEQCPAQ
jgi:WD40 repeat protein/class 3 adenylate cyclase/energy-coupling factor transporter ATP-binding protein EcfA2